MFPLVAGVCLLAAVEPAAQPMTDFSFLDQLRDEELSREELSHQVEMLRTALTGIILIAGALAAGLYTMYVKYKKIQARHEAMEKGSRGGRNRIRSG